LAVSRYRQKVKFEYRGEQSHDSVISEIVALSRQTGKPMAELYRVRSRITSWAYFAWALSMALCAALTVRFHLSGWRAFAVTVPIGFALTFALGFARPLYRYRIEVKREDA
jgi:hypothetical protein